MNRELELIGAIGEHFAEIQKLLNELNDIAQSKHVVQPENIEQNSNEESNLEEVKEAGRGREEIRGLFAGMNLFGAKDKP